ncbi:YbhB/YbcL family Raf kinase inhibitor-like protein [Gilliamella sp. M0364]|uniref:YbhB/YbcL family Raf kinase inhibitor-like protein n=1 Tax=Gilliamella sp. M0364 TaxID=2751011 RepID=UPI00351C1C4A|nr:YbhB/YbcL family Raf kinase inhibitor-like protein [Gilliamella sp. M0364]
MIIKLGDACTFDCLADQLKLIIPELAKDRFTSKFIANQFGCIGDNISPQIEWLNIPTNAKSLVLTMYDPDAPTGCGWWHWQVVNIPL